MPATMIGHESMVVKHPMFLYCIVQKDLNNTEKLTVADFQSNNG
jgi:hypothetical protein